MMRTRLVCLFLAALPLACAGPAERTTSMKVSLPTTRLVVSDMDGNTADLSRTMEAGKPVALVFWQTWCASCLAEAPELVEAARMYGDEIAFFGVVPGPDDTVDDGKVREVAGRLGLSYPQIRDRDLALTRRFSVEGTPTILVLESEGKLLYRGHRVPDDWSSLLPAGRR